jgi:photosystem II stability/assembly factor-like uncharacterized protein
VKGGGRTIEPRAFVMILAIYGVTVASAAVQAQQAFTRTDTLSHTRELVVRPAVTTASLRGLSIARDGSIWASGSLGTVLRSLDTGTSWQALSVPGAASLDLRDVEAVSATTAYAMVAAQDTGRIYKTTDGGRHWTVQYDSAAPSVFLDGFAFWDAWHGVAFGDPIGGRWLVLETTDGARWRALPTGPVRAATGEAGFAASGTSIATAPGGHLWIGTGGASAHVLHARRFGARWDVAVTPIPAGSASAGIFSLAFVDSLTGIAVGGDYRAPDIVRANVARTADGGRTWTLADSARVVKFLSGVAYVPGMAGKVVVGVGPRGVFWSRNGGFSWEQVSAAPYNSVAATKDRVVMVGDRGAIATWDQVRSTTRP